MAICTFDHVRSQLTERLGALPGLVAQERMAPVPRPGWITSHYPAGVRLAAALLALFPTGDGGTSLLLTKRSGDVPTHRGQVSLPGGAVEPGEDIEHAALREAHEEVGLDPASVSVCGVLTAIHIPVSGFLLHPVIGLIASRPRLDPAPREVSRVIEVQLDDLFDPARHRRVVQAYDQTTFDMPYFDLDGEQVWGATAMVLAEFAAVLGVTVVATDVDAPRRE